MQCWLGSMEGMSGHPYIQQCCTLASPATGISSDTKGLTQASEQASSVVESSKQPGARAGTLPAPQAAKQARRQGQQWCLPRVVTIKLFP